MNFIEILELFNKKGQHKYAVPVCYVLFLLFSTYSITEVFGIIHNLPSLKPCILFARSIE